MPFIYFKNSHGKRVYVQVNAEVLMGYTKTRQAIWNNDAKEKYHRRMSLCAFDKDKLSGSTLNPEDIYIAAEERLELKMKLLAAVASLTAKQTDLVKLLIKGLKVSEVARLWGKNQSSVYEMKKAVEKKFERFCSDTP